MTSPILNFQSFAQSLAPYNDIALTAPAGADGDSVGTQCSLREALLQIYPNKTIRVINEDSCPHRYQLLKGTEIFETASEVVKSPPAKWPEVMICVDGGFSRIGTDATKIWLAAKKRGQVDHHAIGGSAEYDLRLYDPKAAATTEIVFAFVREMKLKLTPSMAQAIYVGLVFDTGLFKHSNTTPKTMRIGADLLETGFDHTTTVERTMLLRTPGAFSMLQVVLKDAKSELGGRYTFGVLGQPEFLSSGGTADDREGIIDQLFLIEKCEIAAFYFEKAPQDWKVSFRARVWDVATLAQSLNSGGGGHRQASGCSLSGPREDVLRACHEAVRKLLASSRNA